MVMVMIMNMLKMQLKSRSSALLGNLSIGSKLNNDGSVGDDDGGNGDDGDKDDPDDDSNVENAVEIQELSFVTHLFFHWQADRCIVHGMFRRMMEMMMVMMMMMMMMMMMLGC